MINSITKPAGVHEHGATYLDRLQSHPGSGYLEFTGNAYSLGEADSPLLYHFKINQGGAYVLDLHCAKMTVEGHTDWANDCYVRVIGDFASAPGPLLTTVPVYRTWTWNDFEATSANLAPAGRLAYVADGNSSDPDDIGGTAATLAMLRAAGLESRLVHLSHSCDLVKADNIPAEMEVKRQTMMQVACDGTISLRGGFAGLTAWNCRTQQEETIRDLTAHINASTAADPLWIVEAGEPDIIGYAPERADPAKRKFVKLLTHHVVNDGSGDFFKYNQILDFGVQEVRFTSRTARASTTACSDPGGPSSGRAITPTRASAGSGNRGSSLRRTPS